MGDGIVEVDRVRGNWPDECRIEVFGDGRQ